MKKIALLGFALVFTVLVVNAQYYYDRSKSPDKVVSSNPTRDFDHFFFLSWDGNTPMSNPDFIKQASSLGTKLGFRKRLNSEDKLWVGADFGWAVYKEYFPYQTYPVSGNQSVSTDLYDYSYNYSLSANIDYFFLPMDKIFVPYAGLGVGGAYDKFAQYWNIYSYSGSSWGLMVRPEAGFLLGYGQNSSWRLKVAYHYDYTSNTNKDFGYKNFINTGFQIGIVKMAW